jgi:hypothetical protein
MLTVLVNLEDGYESTFEHLAFRQLKGAYGCNLVSVGHDFATFQEALDFVVGTKVFLVPPGKTPRSTEYADWTPPEGDLVFCFGSPQEHMLDYIGNDTALHITTPDPTVDMMALSVAAIVLYGHGQ